MGRRLKLDEWADGRAKPVAMLAHVVALCAPECHQGTVRARQGLPGFIHRVGQAEGAASPAEPPTRERAAG